MDRNGGVATRRLHDISWPALTRTSRNVASDWAVKSLFLRLELTHPRSSGFHAAVTSQLRIPP
jgi:hypothetical protein